MISSFAIQRKTGFDSNHSDHLLNDMGLGVLASGGKDLLTGHPTTEIYVVDTKIDQKEHQYDSYNFAYSRKRI